MSSQSYKNKPKKKRKGHFNTPKSQPTEITGSDQGANFLIEI